MAAGREQILLGAEQKSIEHDACVVEGIRSCSFSPLLPSSLGNRLRG